MTSSRDTNEHAAAREPRTTPSIAADPGAMENSTSRVQNGCPDKSSVADESNRGPVSTPETNGNETVFEDMGFRDGAMASVLLIEDDKETANEIRAELGDRGYAVDWAADGIEGLDKARSGEAEIVIDRRLHPHQHAGRDDGLHAQGSGALGRRAEGAGDTL